MGPIARASCFMPCLLEGAVAAVVTRVHTCSHCSFICWLLVVASVSCGCEVAASHVQLYQETYDASTKSLGDSMASPTSPTCEDFCYNWLNVNPVYVLKSQYCSDLMGGVDPVIFYEPGKEYLQLFSGSETPVHRCSSNNMRWKTQGICLELEGLGFFSPLIPNDNPWPASTSNCAKLHRKTGYAAAQ